MTVIALASSMALTLTAVRRRLATSKNRCSFLAEEVDSSDTTEPDCSPLKPDTEDPVLTIF